MERQIEQSDLSTISRKKAALLFPGQGSQTVGMGKDVYDTSLAARNIYAAAGDEIVALCFTGPEDKLNQTIYSQPAIYTTSIALYEAYKERDGLVDKEPQYVAGHSLGELSALVASGAVDFITALKLVEERGRLMQEAGEKHPGRMGVIIGLVQDKVEVLVEDTRRRHNLHMGQPPQITISNYNTHVQHVVSGAHDLVAHAMEAAKEEGAKLARVLPISIASHSPLMQSAQDRFHQALRDVQILNPEIPIFLNTTAKVSRTAKEIKRELARSLTHPVRWADSVKQMAKSVDVFVEIGPGKSLSRTVQELAPDKEVETINSAVALSRYSKFS